MSRSAERGQRLTPDVTVLPRHTLQHADGRRLFVYGGLHGELATGSPTVAGDAPAQLHLRRDVLSDTWVAVSPDRNERPQTRGAGTPACPLCPGGPEVPFPYDAAVFENRFPTFVADPPPPPQPDSGSAVGELLQVAPSQGHCEVVLYTSQHEGSLATLDAEQLLRVVAIWRDRSQALWSDARNAVVLVFENRGEAVGATLSHPHGQIYTFDHVPPIVAGRVAALARHRRAAGRCLTCEVVEVDRDASERVVVKNDSFVVATPFAARWPYEVHVRAREHGVRRLGDLDDDGQRDLARALRAVVGRYDRIFDFPLPYMMVVQEAPRGAADPEADWHLSFEFLPPHRHPDKLKVRASVETATGLFINDTLPEASATELADVAVAEDGWDDVAVPQIVAAGEVSP